MMKSLSACVAFLLLVGAVFATFWSYDVWEDRKHTITVREQTPVFAGNGNELCDGASQLVVAEADTMFHAKRIRYWKNCATIDVALTDRRKGYVVLGVGKVSIDPPLQ